jgi:hypothetical protein
MSFPSKIRGLRVVTVVAGFYGLLWMIMEGALYRAIIMALLLSLVASGLIMQRFLGGRSLSKRGWTFALAGIGSALGCSAAVLTLLLMGVKTGLHGHGPEFTQEEAEWIVRQIVIWGGAGLLGGFGFGLVTARPTNQHETGKK